MPEQTPDPGKQAAETAGKAPKGGRARKLDPAERKQAILDAALHEFAERGFEAARLDDVAARCGVAKGTLYLYFNDKESLFEEVVRGAALPVLEHVRALAGRPDLSFEQGLSALYAIFEKEILGTPRKLLIRLIIAEGPRFPRIAQFYFENVIAQVLPVLRALAERAVERGELADDAIARYPQLIAAPLLTAVIWDSLFSKLQPLDVEGFLRAHRELLTGRPPS